MYYIGNIILYHYNRQTFPNVSEAKIVRISENGVIEDLENFK